MMHRQSEVCFEMPKTKLQMQQQRSGELTLLRELSALSRAPSLRDPSTTCHPKDASVHRRKDRSSQEEVEDQRNPGWENKIVGWIDGGLREGERKQELLRSIDKLIHDKEDQHEKPPKMMIRNSAAPPRRRHANVKDRSRSSAKPPPRWRDDELGGDPEYERQLAFPREAGYHDDDDDDTTSSSSDSDDDFVSHSESPLLERRRARPGCGFSLGLHDRDRKALVPHRSENGHQAEEPEVGAEFAHGCGMPWHWSKHKGKSFLEVAGRSLSCGYTDLPRRKSTGTEIIPVPGLKPGPNLGLNNGQQYQMVPVGNEAELETAAGKKHRSLSQKYRPKTFKEMVGQNMLVQALSNAVSRGRIAPVYLFHGPRGTGKTSAARILAAALNCGALEPEARPCGVCRECLLLLIGKSTEVKEVDVASHNADVNMRKVLAEVAVAPLAAGRYKVFILDECHTLTGEAWNVLLKCLEDPPEHGVFILTSSEAEKVPQPATTRCQKFLFSKIKDGDIVERLKKLAANESMDVEMDALELIAARSGGSLRDAETTLEQLGLVGQRITLTVVQELVGLISNEKLAVLLDLALTGDTLSTVKCLRELVDSGVEPLALMSQIATLITDILAGGFVPTNEKGFFQKHILTREQLEKLRQALKTLSESEKQIRSSSDPTTWLTAALLQFAPDSCPVFHTSSAGTSGTPSVMAANDTSEKETIEWEPVHKQVPWDDDGFDFRTALHPENPKNQPEMEIDTSMLSNSREERTQHPQSFEAERTRFERQQKLRDTWMRVLEASQSHIMKQLLWNYGRLLSLSIEGGRAVAYLEFQHVEHRTSAERSKTSISQAFQIVLGFPVEVRIVLPGERIKNSAEQPFHQQQQQQPPQTDYINSRSFPGFNDRVKVDAEAMRPCRGSWGHEQFQFAYPENHADHELHGGLHNSGSNKSSGNGATYAFYQAEEGRNEFQQSGRRFKVKTVRNFSADSTCENGKNTAAAESKKSSGGTKLINSGLLCWKANRVDEDDDDDEEVSVPSYQNTG